MGTRYPPEDRSAGASDDFRRAKRWAILCHAMAITGFVIPFVGNILGPLLVWVLKKDEFPLVNEQGKEAVNFQILMSLLYVGGAILAIFLVGVLLLIGFGLYSLVMTLIAMYRTYKDGAFRYPITVRMVR